MNKNKILFYSIFIIFLALTFIYVKNNELIDNVYSDNSLSKNISIDKAIVDKGCINEKNITSSVKSLDNFSFTPNDLSIDNPTSTLNLKIKNTNSKKVNIQIDCYTDSKYIKVYPNKNNYDIYSGSDNEIIINVELNNNINNLEEAKANFKCQLYSSIDY